VANGPNASGRSSGPGYFVFFFLQVSSFKQQAASVDKCQAACYRIIKEKEL
jgi:hypothetical protein